MLKAKTKKLDAMIEITMPENALSYKRLALSLSLHCSNSLLLIRVSRLSLVECTSSIGGIFAFG